MTTDIDTMKLVPEYDVLRLQDDFRALGVDRFRLQASFKRGRVIEGSRVGWRVLSLRSPGGDPTRTDPGGPGFVDYLDTPLLDETPYIASVLSSLRIPLGAVRLMSLEPGESVGEHADNCGFPLGSARLHLPIVTNEGAVMVIGGREHRWRPGELWYANFALPHSVHNRGSHTRVHLVIDCYIGEAFLDLIPPDMLPHIDRSETIFCRAERPVPVTELNALTGPVSIPATFLQAFFQAQRVLPELVDGLTPDCEGVLRIVDGQLLLISGERLKVALVHLGDLEFRTLGSTEQRTIKFDFRDGARRIRYRHRFGSNRTEVVREHPFITQSGPA
jgi:hypothetical protein